jgi:hypothetical protein
MRLSVHAGKIKPPALRLVGESLKVFNLVPIQVTTARLQVTDNGWSYENTK